VKRIALIITIVLFSLNTQAFEQVIGISGGISSSKSSTNHFLTAEYDNRCYQQATDPTCDNIDHSINTTDKRIQKTFSNISDNVGRGNGYNFNIEYQARLDLTNRPNFITLGLGFENSKRTIKPNYQNLDDISYDTNSPYLIAMLTLFQQKSFSFKAGFTLGQEFVKIDSNEKDTSQAINLIADFEYAVSKHILLFTRGSAQLNKGEKIIRDTDLRVGNLYCGTTGNPPCKAGSSPNENIDILSNQIEISPTDSQYKLNFGVRYRI
jgi:hypothetical protein